MSVPENTVQVQGQGAASASFLNSLPQIVSNLAALRNFTGIDPMTVLMLGTNTPADGGQAFYYWSATTTGPDNPPSLVLPHGSVQGGWIIIPLGGGASASETPAAVAPPNATTAITTSHSATTTLTGMTTTAGRLYSVTTDGSGQRQVINIPALTLDANGNNLQFYKRSLTIALGTRANASDVVQITCAGSTEIPILGTSLFTNAGNQATRNDATTGGVRLTTAGQSAVFAWTGKQWEFDQAASAGNDASNLASLNITLVPPPELTAALPGAVVLTGGQSLPGTGNTTGGGIYITGGEAYGSGGDIGIYGGQSTGTYGFTSQHGGSIFVNGGQGYKGGSIHLNGGIATSTTSGGIYLYTHNAPTIAGKIHMVVGNSANGGGGPILAGAGQSSNSDGGYVTIYSGLTNSPSGPAKGGPITIRSGNATYLTGGPISVTSGGGHVAGGDITVTSGHGNTSTGGNIFITSGNSTASSAGNITITIGTSGAGAGHLFITGLPTSDPMVSGACWLNSHVLTVSP